MVRVAAPAAAHEGSVTQLTLPILSESQGRIFDYLSRSTAPQRLDDITAACAAEKFPRRRTVIMVITFISFLTGINFIIILIPEAALKYTNNPRRFDGETPG